LFEDLLLDGAQAAHLLAHLDFGVAVGLQHRLGHIAQEVVDAVAVRHVGELGGDALDEGILLVRHPQLHRLAQLLDPLLGLGQQTLHLVGAAGQQGLGEPDPLAAQLADDVEGFVPLLRLQAVDGQDQVVDVLVSRRQHGAVVVAGGDHPAVALQVAGDGVVGQRDAIAVAQLGLELGDGPVAGEAAKAEPGEDVPGDEPPGQGDVGFRQRSEGVVVSRAGGVRTVSQFADQFQGTGQGEDTMETMVTDMEAVPTQGAGLLLDGQHDGGEGGVLRPTVAHGCPSWHRFLLLSYEQPFTGLALYRAVVENTGL
jgi:hypothetical protein